MDFSNRSVQPQATPSAPSHAPGGSSSKKSKGDMSLWSRVATMAVVVSVAILLGATTVLIGIGGPKQEKEFVDSSKLQAVFLNTGQVYFGNVTSLNSKYVVLRNIYYLQTSSSNTTAASTSASSNVTLVKLGCELHEPLDQMVINRDQVTFWENLGTNGQVATAVSTFEKDNPNGQKCADQSSSSSSTTNTVQNAPTSNKAN